MYEIQNFETDVLDRSRQVPVVVDFWAEWCGPCRVLGPVLETLAGRSGGKWVLAKVDTERNPQIAEQYGIRGIPNVKLFVDAEVVDEFTGALPEQMVVRWLEAALPDPSHEIIERARQLLSDGDRNGAIRVLTGIIEEYPGNQQARVVLARARVLEDPAAVEALLAGIEEDSEYFQEASALSTIVKALGKANDGVLLPEGPEKSRYLNAHAMIARGEYDGAVAELIEVIRNDRMYDDDGARRLCVALFVFLGEEDPVTLRYRRAFAGALNI